MPLPAVGFLASLEPWLALVAIFVIPVWYMVCWAAMGLCIGLHEGLKEIGYKALTGRKWPSALRRRRPR